MSRFTEQHVEAAARHLAQMSRARQARLDAERSRIRARVADVARRFRDELGAERTWLIGSVDAPWFHETSDVDLVVEGLTEAGAVRAERIALAELGRPVDLLRFEELAASFREAVLADGRPLP